MAGVKGRSGRKSNRDEGKRLAAIETSWDIYIQFLNDPEIEIQKKIDAISKIITKDMPTQIEGEMTYTRMTSILIEKRLMELNFGNDVGDTRDIANAAEASSADNGD